MTKILFYDFETFSHDWLMTAIEADGTVNRVHNNITAFKSFYNAHKDFIWVGYNSSGYDSRIVSVLMNSETDKEAINNAWWANTKIIGEHNTGALYRRFNMNKYPIIGFDVHLTGDRTLSLKDCEGFLGLTVMESSVPWNIDRPLTHEELEEVFYYNELDVRATIEVFNYRAQNLKDKLALINEHGLNLTDLSGTDQAITAKVLKAEPMSGDDELKPIKLPKYLSIKDTRITDFYNQPVDYSKKLVLEKWGQTVVYAWGGMHSAIENYFKLDGDMLQIDVSSYYPAEMAKLGLLPRSVPEDMRHTFNEWYDKRVFEWKPNHDPRAATYKLINNTIFGAGKSETSKLYDPRASLLITVLGQLGLTDLIEKLEGTAELIQANTDGILVKTKDKDKTREIAEEWATRTKMSLEYDDIDKVWQRDVNNYIVQYPNGKVKVKGAVVKQSKFADKTSREFQNSESVLADAVVNYFVNGVDPKDTIKEAYKNNEVMAFQRIMKVGKSNYQKVWYGDDREEVYFTNRTFASKDESLGTLKKVKLLSNEQFADKQRDIITKYQLEIDEIKFSDRSDTQKEKMIKTRYRQREKALSEVSRLSVQEAVGNQAKHVLIHNEAITDEIKLKDLNLDYNYYLVKSQLEIAKFTGEVKGNKAAKQFMLEHYYNK